VMSLRTVPLAAAQLRGRGLALLDRGKRGALACSMVVAVFVFRAGWLHPGGLARMAASGDCALRARESGVDIEARKSVPSGGGCETFQKGEE
jgi:hypothetical protein